MYQAIFLYDHNFFVHGNDVYSSGAFTSCSWDRYLDHFNTLTVVGNLINLENGIDINSFNKVSKENVRFEFIPSITSFGQYIKHMFLPSNKLKRLILKHDAVIIRLFSENGYSAVNIARKNNIPYAIEVVGCPFDAYWNHQNILGKFFAPISYYKMKKCVSNAHYVIYVTQEFLQRRYPTKGVQTYASNVLLPRSDETILVKRITKIKSNSGIVKIGMIGGLEVKAKGHAVLMKALKNVKSEIQEFRLLIVGQGRHDYILSLGEKHNLTEHIEIVGKLKSGSYIMSFLDDIDLFVIPSKQEGLPRALIEAMSRGCPVLGSNVAGIPELLSGEYLHHKNDYVTLGKQLVRVLNSEKEMISMANINFSRTKEFQDFKLKEKRFKFWNKYAETLKV